MKIFDQIIGVPSGCDRAMHIADMNGVRASSPVSSSARDRNSTGRARASTWRFRGREPDSGEGRRLSCPSPGRVPLARRAQSAWRCATSRERGSRLGHDLSLQLPRCRSASKNAPRRSSFVRCVRRSFQSGVAGPIPLFDGGTLPSSRLGSSAATRAGAVEDDAQRHRHEPARSVLDGGEHGAMLTMAGALRA